MALARKKGKCPPWLDLFDSMGPVERLLRRDDPVLGDGAEKDALVELDRRVARLAEHLGASTFRQMLLTVLSKLHPAFTIIDPPPRAKRKKTTARWAAAEGVQFLHHVAALRDDGNEHLTVDDLLEELRRESPRYGDMEFDTLKSRYFDAMRYHPSDAERLGLPRRYKKSTKRRQK